MNHQTAMWALVLFGSAAAAQGQTPGTISGHAERIRSTDG